MEKILEVCTGSFVSVENAVAGGARRIELCSALSLDGLTPSLGLLETVRKKYPALRIHMLIRPREGDFVYAEEEVRIMERDITAALPYADAFVGGALTAEGDIDLTTTQRLVTASAGKPFTFHRAFDKCRDARRALEELVRLGCTRILTSGQQLTATEGIPLLRELVGQAAGRIGILPGGGVTAANAAEILCATGAMEIHGSLSVLQPNGQKETSAEKVHSLLDNLKRL